MLGTGQVLSMPQERGVVIDHCLHKESEVQRGWVTCPRLHSNRSRVRIQTQVSDLWEPSTNFPTLTGW